MFELESREKGRAGDEYCTKKKNEIPKYGECKIQDIEKWRLSDSQKTNKSNES